MSDESDKQWPGVHRAYDFVLPSYQLLSTRLEAIVIRIQGLMTFSASITLGFPVLGRAVSPDISFQTWPFVSAVSCFAVLMVIGIVVRDMGRLKISSPAKIYATSLHLSEWEFKRDQLYLAGQCFEHNSTLANKKALAGQWMSLLLLMETVAFLIWIARAT